MINDSPNESHMTLSGWPLRIIFKDWKRYLLILAPILFSWMPIFYNSSEARCAYVILLMALFFMVEALPLAITALIPVFAFPLLGIISTEDICRVYMKGTAMMFFGGLAVAVAVEHSNLHKRIALFVILKMGQSPRRIMISFMLTSMILSMFISNTAATAMMVPILDAILQELYKTHREPDNQKEIKLQLETEGKKLFRVNGATKNSCDMEVSEISRQGSCEKLLPPDKEAEDLSIMYFLALAYGANIGGTGFPTGSSPNLILWGVLQSAFPEGTGLTFPMWMAFNIPGMLLCIIAACLWLELLFRGCGSYIRSSNCLKENEASVRNLVQKHYESLGELTFHEICVTISFMILVFLWVFRAPEFIDGWADHMHALFKNNIKVGNATPAMLMVFILFILPSKLPWTEPNKPTQACLTWDVVQRKIPWGLIILMGGGFAMAEASNVSGLSLWLKYQLQVLEVLPAPLIAFLVCISITFLTEVVSNATAASIFLPVLKDMALALKIHPLYLMLPGAVCCSYAFMLPVSNPPNAIVFNASTMKNSHMIKAGFVLNIICVLVLNGLINTLGVFLFDFHSFPEWAIQSSPVNGTVVS